MTSSKNNTKNTGLIITVSIAAILIIILFINNQTTSQSNSNGSGDGTGHTTMGGTNAGPGTQQVN